MTEVDASMAVDGDMGVFFADEQPEAVIAFTGPAGQTLRGQVVVQDLRLADLQQFVRWGADVRLVEADILETVPVTLQLSEQGQAELAVPLPTDRFGVKGVTVILEDGERIFARYLGSAAVVPTRDVEQWHVDGPFLASLHYRWNNREAAVTHTADGGLAPDITRACKKMGIDWVRLSANWPDYEPQPGVFDFERADAMVSLLRENHIYAMHLANFAPEWARPETDDLKTFTYKGQERKVDWMPHRAYLDDWRDAHAALYERHKDVIRATNVWNEPWEGMGITGWHSHGGYYRELVRKIRDAVDAVDPSILVLAADSSHNTEWKLAAADEMSLIDGISTHYESPKSAYAFALRNHYDKQL